MNSVSKVTKVLCVGEVVIKFYWKQTCAKEKDISFIKLRPNENK